MVVRCGQREMRDACRVALVIVGISRMMLGVVGRMGWGSAGFDVFVQAQTLVVVVVREGTGHQHQYAD